MIIFLLFTMLSVTDPNIVVDPLQQADPNFYEAVYSIVPDPNMADHRSANPEFRLVPAFKGTTMPVGNGKTKLSIEDKYMVAWYENRYERPFLHQLIEDWCKQGSGADFNGDGRVNYPDFVLFTRGDPNDR